MGVDFLRRREHNILNYISYPVFRSVYETKTGQISDKNIKSYLIRI